MERLLYRELWGIRFQKMFDLEKNSVRDYGALLEECRLNHSGHPIITHLEHLIADEKKHMRLVEELQAILGSQKE